MYQRKNQMQELFLCAIDAVCVSCSFVIAGLFRFGNIESFKNATDIPTALMGIVLVHFVSFYILKIYDDLYSRGSFREVWKVAEYDVLLLMGVSLYAFMTKNVMEMSRLTIFYFAAVNAVLIFLCHLITKMVHRNTAIFEDDKSNLLLITSSDLIEKAIDKLQEPSDLNCKIGGAVVLDKDMTGQIISGVPVVAGQNDYLDYATLNVVDEALLYLSDLEEKRHEIREMILNLEQMGIVVNLNIDVFSWGVEGSKIVYRFGNCYVLAFTSRLFDYRLLIMKRVMDIIGSVVGLFFTFIIGIFLAPILLLESSGPLIFSQERVGRNGRVFRFYKFRSMYRDAEERKAELMAQNEMDGGMFKITNDPRITKVGKFIRKTSIDELPQFWNVLKGDMSLVGTRPPTVDEYQQYNNRQKRRISFRPGITGLWQISGRSNIKEFDEVVKLDLEYIDNWSLGLDVKIIIKTIGAVFGGIGAR